MYRKHVTIINPEKGPALHTLDSYGIVRRVGGLNKNLPASPATASDMLRDGAIESFDFIITSVAYAMEFGYDMEDLIETAHDRGLPLEHIDLMSDSDKVGFAQQALERASIADRMDAALARALEVQA